MIAWAFPGQGSQRARMGAALPGFAALAADAKRTIGVDLERLCVADPQPSWRPDELQQAIFVTTRAAAVNAREQAREQPQLSLPDAVVGHSLGEFAALVEAGALGYTAALHLVDVRGRAMAEAGAARPGAMVAVVGLAHETVADTCAALNDVWVANVNSPTQTVISGAVADVQAAADSLDAAGARMVVRLPISIACHTPLMAPAAERLRAALDEIELQQPAIPFYSAVDAQPRQHAADIATALVDGVTRPVLFSATVRRMRDDGIDGFVEVGPGRVLRGLVRENAPELPRAAIATYDER
ncbi:MAG TPA: acyltransferase domain-containing protein [Conexibacter sp.]|nr:acyltransferase domain-containing protein [Conexibacter sp.]